MIKPSACLRLIKIGVPGDGWPLDTNACHVTQMPRAQRWDLKALKTWPEPLWRHVGPAPEPKNEAAAGPRVLTGRLSLCFRRAPPLGFL
jgi:hypothetical protein